MGIQARLLIATVVILAIAFAGLEYLAYRHARDDVILEVHRTAEQIRGVLMATRRIYHQQFMDSGLPVTDRTVGFLPSHALSRISREFSNWVAAGLTFNNVSDQPRNPDNQANAVELEAMAFFRANPRARVRMERYDNPDGSHYYHYARPIHVETYCLTCHGNREEAPATIRDRYDSAYGYQVGELRGIMSITIPDTFFEHHFAPHLTQNLKIHLLTFAAIFLMLGHIQRHFFITPMRRLQHGIQAIAAGDFTRQIHGLIGEFQQIGQAFNRMATALAVDKARREQADANLRNSQERMHSLLVSTGEAIFGVDLAGRCTFSNPACLKLLGYATDEALLGREMHALLHPQGGDGQPLTAGPSPLHRTLHGGEPVHLDDVVLRRADGSRFRAEYRSHPILKSGRVDGAVVTFTDVTARVAARNAARRTHRTLDTLNRCNQSLIHSANPEQLLNRICETIVKTDGYQLAWVGMAIHDERKRVEPVARYGPGADYLDSVTVTWADEPLGQGPVGTAIRENRSVAIRHIHDDPRFEPWREEAMKRGFASVLACPLIIEGETIGALNIYSSEADAFDDQEIALLQSLADNIAFGIHSFQDTEAKRQAEEALRASEETLRTLFHHSPDLIITFNRRGEPLFHNRPPPEHLSMPFSRTRESRCRSHLDQVFDSGQPVGFLCSNESGHWWEIRLAPIAREGQVQSVMAVFTDVTEKKRLQDQAAHSARLITLGELSAGIAHEINNPNSAIQFNESILTEVWRDAEPFLRKAGRDEGAVYLGDMPLEEALATTPRLLEGIHRSSRRVAAIIDNLKRMARRDAGDMDEQVDIQVTLASAFSILQGQIAKYTDQCILHPAEDLPLIAGNSLQLEQVFINLIVNALQSLPSRRHGVAVAATADDQGITVTVTDEGCGISKENLGRLTNPFFTTRPESGGTGLGLSISLTIVQNHRGRLHFESRLGQGTRASVWLPLNREKEDAAGTKNRLP